MPDVGLFTATEPLTPDIPLVIKFSVEAGGLPVYQESYCVETLAKELEEDEEKAVALWVRRLKCVVAARKRPGFSAAVTRCLADGVSADYGAESEAAGAVAKVDEQGVPSR